MALMHRLTRQARPIQSAFVRYASNKPPAASTITHVPLTGQKSIPQADETTAYVPAPTPPVEDHVPIPADIVSGAPESLHRRTVRIYRPAKSAMQSGLHGNLHWRLDWDVKPDDNRWEHPVMYWAASADYMQGTRLNFNTKEDAIAFAEKQGWEYYIQEPHNRQFKPKAYATNFNYSPSKLKVIITK